MRTPVLLLVLLILFSLIYISIHESDMRNLIYKKDILKAPTRNCVFSDGSDVASDYYASGLYFIGNSNFNGHLSLSESYSSEEIFCPFSQTIRGKSVDFLRVKCGNQYINCHAYENELSAHTLTFSYGVSECNFREDCSNDEICILRMNQAENSHIAECSYTDYNISVCCSVLECDDNSSCAAGYKCENGYCVFLEECGNGIIDLDEECDCGNPWDCSLIDLNNKSCSNFSGYTGGNLGCYPVNTTRECDFNLSQCVPEEDEVVCGDSIIDYNEGEYCDIANGDLQYCAMDPAYMANASLQNLSLRCVNENGFCRCKWDSSGDSYSFGECHCPDGETCEDNVGISDKYLVSIDPVTGESIETLVGQVECDLLGTNNKIRLSAIDNLMMTLIFLGLMGGLIGISFYLKKRKI